jgi:preprotein translocase SecE subunit
MKKSIIKETKAELKKVIWPSAKDVTFGTVSVIVISGIVGVFIMLADVGSLKLVNFVTTQISGLIG